MSTRMTQVHSAVATKSQFKQYVEEQADTNHSLTDENFCFQTLVDATETILYYAFWLAEQKKNCSPKQYRKLLDTQGWKGEEKRYLKVAAAFQKFSPEDLAQIEPRTIYQLAENSNKYQPVIDTLLDLSAITQQAVRSLIKKQTGSKKESTPEKPSIWRRTKNGGRYCQIPPIHEPDDRTGVALQKMMDEEGLSAQHIVAEAIALRQAQKEGRLMVVEERVSV